MSGLTWLPPGYPGDRLVLQCGLMPVGAVFPPQAGRYWRWRCWVTIRIHPCDGVSRSEADAKRMVEVLFRDFLQTAGLVFASATCMTDVAPIEFPPTPALPAASGGREGASLPGEGVGAGGSCSPKGDSPRGGQ
jgi:hypothetical protein